MVPMNASDDELVGWLVEGDPSIRWRVHQDLIGSSATMVRAERAKVATESWGAKLIALQDPDGVAEPMAGCAPYQGPLANLCRIPRPYLVPDGATRAEQVEHHASPACPELVGGSRLSRRVRPATLGPCATW